MAPPSEQGRSAALSWRVEEQHGLTTVHLSGDLDLAAGDALVEAVTPLLLAGSVLVFDLAELEFIDSTGIRILGGLKRDADRNGRRFLLGRISGPVRRVFHVAGLIDYFEYVEGPPSDDVLCRACDKWVPATAVRCIHCGGPL